MEFLNIVREFLIKIYEVIKNLYARLAIAIVSVIKVIDASYKLSLQTL